MSSALGRLSDFQLKAILGWGRGYPAAVLSGFALALPFVIPECFLVGWIALIPLLAVLAGSGVARSWRLASVAGFVQIAVGMPWIAGFISDLASVDSVVLGRTIAAGYWFYAGQSLALAAIVSCWLERRHRLGLIAFPFLYASSLCLFPFVVPFRLAEGQSEFLVAAQNVALTGSAGLDLVMLMTNVAVFRLLRGDALWDRFNAPVCAILAGWLIGGWFGLGEWRSTVDSWPRASVGLVQPDIAPGLEPVESQPGFSRLYSAQWAVTEDLAALGADLIVWPESRDLGYFEEKSQQDYWRSGARALGISLLMGDRDSVSVDGREYNSLVMLGEQTSTYRKVQRIPFGEYIPAVFRWSMFSAISEEIFSGFTRSIEAGSGPVPMVWREWGLAPAICFESQWPETIARSVQAGSRPAGVALVIASDDAWFADGLQPLQHQRASRLRALENRVPLIHVINNGPSLVLSPAGDSIFESEAGKPSAAVVTMPIGAGSGQTLYSRFPGWFDWLILSISIGLIVLGLLTPVNRETAPQRRQGPPTDYS